MDYKAEVSRLIQELVILEGTREAARIVKELVTPSSEGDFVGMVNGETGG